SVAATKGDSERCQRQHQEMNVHSRARPGADPSKGVIGEVKLRLHVVEANTTAGQVIPRPPGQDRAEPNPDQDQPGDIDGAKQVTEKPRELRRIALIHTFAESEPAPGA